ncbi:hypothetical protein HPO96_22310 [Kribbella sandramycini]|uniref:DUF308 domain-containing protein n=1 Tax=Kribbella sandramycini TaxID=60450 RepID=A0A7Y4L275_9ACTN|nr:hypothetical protein [Kribbella sandramycini]MBB6566354.1 hypothetical protein [Kribbella sandramycini]NOL42985.1 hypothetical protein [Kribbella sandramycini]
MQAKTVIGHSTLDKLILFGGLPVAGLVLGFFLPRFADWAVTKPWMPWKRILEVIGHGDAWWVVLICTVVGGLAGLLLGAIALDDTLKVTITHERVEFLKNEQTLVVPREKVSVAFLDGKQIVLLDATSKELAREKHDQLKGEAKQIPQAFRAHGYPWTDSDPYESRFRRWVEDEPELPPTVNALLKARARSFDDDKGKADLRELRDEVIKLGFTVKDRDKKQYWRPTTPN